MVSYFSTSQSCSSSNCVSWISTSCFPVSGSMSMTASASLPSTPVSPVLKSGFRIVDYWTPSAYMGPVPSPCLPVVARSRAPPHRPPGSAGSRPVGPQVSRSASMDTSASLKSVPVPQTVVSSVLPSPQRCLPYPRPHRRRV